MAAVKVTISADERKRIPPLLKGYGYRKKGNKYLLHGSPVVKVKAFKKKEGFTNIHMKLAKPIVNRVIWLSNSAVIIVKGDDAWFHYTISTGRIAIR